jgi:hypothetical protein
MDARSRRSHVIVAALLSACGGLTVSAASAAEVTFYPVEPPPYLPGWWYHYYVEGDKEEPGRRSKKVGRGLLVGAAWVAACSYAVGVVAEFFKTGGSDGKGPVGF